MFYQDCMAQLGFISTLIVAYFLLMLAHPSYVNSQNEVSGVLGKGKLCYRIYLWMAFM